MSNRRFIDLAFVVALLLTAPKAFSQFTFENATLATGISQTCQSTIDVGGGVIVIDYDNDSWKYLYLPGGAQHDKLYKNIWNGTFTDVTDPTFAKHNNVT